MNGSERGTYRDFSEGKWIEFRIDNAVTKDGAIDIAIKHVTGRNAVVSNIRFEMD